MNSEKPCHLCGSLPSQHTDSANHDYRPVECEETREDNPNMTDEENFLVRVNKEVIRVTNQLYRPDINALYVPVENEQKVLELRKVVRWLIRDFISQELSRLEEEKDRAIAKTRIDTKIDMIGIFHAVIGLIYGNGLADTIMKIVNAYADALITKKENSK